MSGEEQSQYDVEQVVDKYHFQCAPFLRERQLRLIKINPEYRHALKIEKTDIYRADIVYRMTHHDNVIISYYGETGSGKSLAATRTGEEIKAIAKELMDVENKVWICFLAQSVLDAVDNCESHDVILLDERVPEFGYGAGREVAQLGNIEATIRKRQIHLLYVYPERQRHFHKMVVQMWDIDEGNEVSRGILEDPASFTYLSVPYGYVLFNKPSLELITEYNEKKDDFLRKTKSRDFSEREDMQRRYAEEIIKIPIFHVAKGAERLEIVKRHIKEQLTIAEYKSILAKAKLQLLEEEAVKGKVADKADKVEDKFKRAKELAKEYERVSSSFLLDSKL